MNQYWLIFLTGLTTGGLTCMALQGGLLAGILIHEGKKQQAALITGLFLLSKLVVHTLLGLILGWLGSVLTLSDSVTLTFQALAALFMLVAAANLLDIHPFFRRFTWQPPAALRRLVKRSRQSAQSSNSSDAGTNWVAPIVLGAVTILIPCGVTQAMELVAINSGSPVSGALTMFFFIVGTIPLFAALALATTFAAERFQKRFAQIAAILLIGLGLYGLNGVLVALDSPLSAQRLSAPFARQSSLPAAELKLNAQGEQEVTINILNSGYSPNYVRVEAGTPVRLILASNETYSCALAFRLREFQISTFLEATDREEYVIHPVVPGKYPFSCSMGMYTGVFEVVAS